jgi:hypothetical protein
MHQCDLRTPACGQCIRVGRSCSGPKHPTDLMFVHQTRKTTGRSTQQEQTHTQAFVSTDAASSHPKHQPQQARHQKGALGPSSYILRLSIDEVGVNWFLRNRRETNSAFALQDHFFSSYHNRTESTDIVQSMTAVGLAGYAKEAQQFDLTQCAEKAYVKALRVINEALSGPDVASKDTLLFSIMMLVMFEINTWPRASGIRNLHNHVNGLLSLNALSVKKGKLTEHHRRLMALTVRFCAFQHWYFHRPLTPEFFTVKEASLPEPEHFQTKLLGLVIELINFEDQVKRRTLDKLSLLEECDRLDDALQHFCRELPPSGQWAEHTVPAGFEDLAYQGILHCKFFPAPS